MAQKLLNETVVDNLAAVAPKLNRHMRRAKGLFRRRGEAKAPEVAASNPDPGGHHHGPGWGWSLFGTCVWLVEVREAINAVITPFAKCHGIGDCVRTILSMSSADFAGVAFWTVALVSSTAALILFLLGKIKWPGDDEDDADGEGDADSEGDEDEDKAAGGDREKED